MGACGQFSDVWDDSQRNYQVFLNGWDVRFNLTLYGFNPFPTLVTPV